MSEMREMTVISGLSPITPDQWFVVNGVMCNVRHVMSARGESHVPYYLTERDELYRLVERYLGIYLSASPERATMWDKYRSVCVEWLLSDLHQMAGDHALSRMWREPVYHLLMGFNN